MGGVMYDHLRDVAMVLYSRLNASISASSPPLGVDAIAIQLLSFSRAQHHLISALVLCAASLASLSYS